MALTRKFLKALGLEDEKIDEVIAAHTETVDALKQERDTLKVDAEKVPGLEKKVGDLETAAKNSDGKDTWKVKYDAIKSDFDTYKADTDKERVRGTKETAYRALLKDVKINDKRHDAIVKLTDLNAIELDDKGAIKGAEDLKKSLATEWVDFISTDGTKPGGSVETPPAGGGTTDSDKMSDAEYFKHQRELTTKK